MEALVSPAAVEMPIESAEEQETRRKIEADLAAKAAADAAKADVDAAEAAEAAARAAKETAVQQKKSTNSWIMQVSEATCIQFVYFLDCGRRAEGEKVGVHFPTEMGGGVCTCIVHSDRCTVGFNRQQCRD